MTRVLSADWVLPVEAAPIENGAVAIEDGRIAAVSSARDLGSGTHYPDAVIVPGFVNAHSHLEYAVYGGFGDGLADFAEGIAPHIPPQARSRWGGGRRGGWGVVAPPRLAPPPLMPSFRACARSATAATAGPPRSRAL